MRQLSWILAVAGVFVLVGCSQPQSGPQKERPDVNLPAKPDLAARPIAEKYADGAWSVDGLTRKASELSGQEVTVRGSILSRELCAAGAACSVESHFILVDDLKKPGKKLQVVGPWSDFDLSSYELNSDQTLKGKVAQWSPSGRLINMDGILVLPVPEPPKEEAETAAK